MNRSEKSSLTFFPALRIMGSQVNGADWIPDSCEKHIQETPGIFEGPKIADSNGEGLGGVNSAREKNPPTTLETLKNHGMVGCIPTVPLTMGNPDFWPVTWVFMGYDLSESLENATLGHLSTCFQSFAPQCADKVCCSISVFLSLRHVGRTRSPTYPVICGGVHQLLLHL